MTHGMRSQVSSQPSRKSLLVHHVAPVVPPPMGQPTSRTARCGRLSKGQRHLSLWANFLDARHAWDWHIYLHWGGPDLGQCMQSHGWSGQWTRPVNDQFAKKENVPGSQSGGDASSQAKPNAGAPSWMPLIMEKWRTPQGSNGHCFKGLYPRALVLPRILPYSTKPVLLKLVLEGKLGTFEAAHPDSVPVHHWGATPTKRCRTGESCCLRRGQAAVCVDTDDSQNHRVSSQLPRQESWQKSSEVAIESQPG